MSPPESIKSGRARAGREGGASTAVGLIPGVPLSKARGRNVVTSKGEGRVTPGRPFESERERGVPGLHLSLWH